MRILVGDHVFGEPTVVMAAKGDAEWNAKVGAKHRAEPPRLSIEGMRLVGDQIDHPGSAAADAGTAGRA